MRYATLVLIISLMLLGACSSQPAPQQVTTTGNQAPPSEGQQASPPSAPAATIPADIKDIMDKASKVKSLFYKYTGPTTGTESTKCISSGTR